MSAAATDPDDRDLSPRARQMLAASADERIEHIRKKVFIPYERAEAILADMERLLKHPATNRPPNMLIAGPSKNGKTEILKRYFEMHPAQALIDGDAIHAPVIYLQAPPGPDERLFLVAILKVLGIAPRSNADPSTLIPILIDSLRKAGVKVILLDELHSILAGSATKQRLMLTLLKYISNETGISIVAAGTRDAKIALSTDAQLESRFPVVALPFWDDKYPIDPQTSKKSTINEIDRMLAGFESVLPLRKASNLHSHMLKTKILGYAEGLLGGISDIVKATAIIAIEDGTESITEKSLSNFIAAAQQRKAESDAI